MRPYCTAELPPQPRLFGRCTRCWSLQDSAQEPLGHSMARSLDKYTADTPPFLWKERFGNRWGNDGWRGTSGLATRYCQIRSIWIIHTDITRQGRYKASHSPLPQIRSLGGLFPLWDGHLCLACNRPPKANVQMHCPGRGYAPPLEAAVSSYAGNMDPWTSTVDDFHVGNPLKEVG